MSCSSRVMMQSFALTFAAASTASVCSAAIAQLPSHRQYAAAIGEISDPAPLGSRLSKSTETPASSRSPTTDPRALARTDGRCPPDRVGPLRRFSALRLTAHGRARGETRDRWPRPPCEAVAGGGSGAPAAGGSRRSMFGSRSNTKNRICGFSVEPISLGGFSSPIAPRKDVKPRPAMSYTRTDGFFTRTPSPVSPRYTESDRLPVASRVARPASATTAATVRTASRTPRAPTPAESFRARSIRSPARPARAFVAFETSTSKRVDVA